MSSSARAVLVTGGAGYIGSVLVRRLLERGHRVRVLDAFLFGDAGVRDMRHDRLEIQHGDIRDRVAVTAALEGCDAVVHLAAMANDPCADLDENLTRGINFSAVELLVNEAVTAGVTRFVNASSATVYGVQEGSLVVDETAAIAPITLYGVLKAETEELLQSAQSAQFEPVSLRAATVCGPSPRLRLDLTVNILTIAALTDGVINIHGGAQVRPNVHIFDLVKAYVAVLEAPGELVAGRSFNVGFENLSVLEIAQRVAASLPQRPKFEISPIVDRRSYRIRSERIKNTLGFVPEFSIDDAVRQLARSYEDGAIPSPKHERYSNIRHLREVGFR